MKSCGFMLDIQIGFVPPARVRAKSASLSFSPSVNFVRFGLSFELCFFIFVSLRNILLIVVDRVVNQRLGLREDRKVVLILRRVATYCVVRSTSLDGASGGALGRSATSVWCSEPNSTRRALPTYRHRKLQSYAYQVQVDSYFLVCISFVSIISIFLHFKSRFKIYRNN